MLPAPLSEKFTQRAAPHQFAAAFAAAGPDIDQIIRQRG
jgi:hypothetical protein